MIDIHSHILSGLDDGSTTMEMSIKMLKMAEESGTKVIVATPHYVKGVYENEYHQILESYKKLKFAAKEADLNIDILLGQEIMLDKHSLQLCKEKRLKGINDTNYILIEFPMNKMPEDALDLIYELKLLDYYPIVAHPERYKYIYENPMNINLFIDEGCYFQINTSSILGLFGSNVQAASKILIKKGIVNFIASDAHSLNKRSTELNKAFKTAKSWDKEIINRVTANAEFMLNNKKIEDNAQTMKKSNKIISFLKKI